MGAYSVRGSVEAQPVISGLSNRRFSASNLPMPRVYSPLPSSRLSPARPFLQNNSRRNHNTRGYSVSKDIVLRKDASHPRHHATIRQLFSEGRDIEVRLKKFLHNLADFLPENPDEMDWDISSQTIIIREPEPKETKRQKSPDKARPGPTIQEEPEVVIVETVTEALTQESTDLQPS
jgi:hypothetical protein